MTAAQITRGTETINYSLSVDEIEISGAGSADSFHVRGLSRPTTINGGNGGDLLYLSSDAPTGAGTLSGIDAALTISGGDGTDSLQLSDRGNIGATSGALTSTTITGLGLSNAGVTYAALESIDVRLGTTAAHAFEVRSLGAGVSATVTGGSSSDTFTIGAVSGSARTVDGILGTLTIDGGNHGTNTSSLTVRGQTQTLNVGDTLNVVDTAQTTERTYSVSSTAVGRDGIATIGFGNIETLRLQTGSARDVVAVASTVAAGTTAIETNAGADEVTVTSTANASNLSVNLGSGTDSVTAAVTGTSTFAVISGGDDADAVELQSVAAAARVNVNGGGAADVMTLRGSAATSLVDFTGGTGSDTFNVGVDDELARPGVGSRVCHGSGTRCRPDNADGSRRESCGQHRRHP